MPARHRLGWICRAPTRAGRAVPSREPPLLLTTRKGAHINLHDPQLLQCMVWPRHKLGLPPGRAAARRRRLPCRVGRQAVQAAQGCHLASVRELHSRQRQGGALGGGAGWEVAQRGAARVQQQLVCAGREGGGGRRDGGFERQPAAACSVAKPASSINNSMLSARRQLEHSLRWLPLSMLSGALPYREDSQGWMREPDSQETSPSRRQP